MASSIKHSSAAPESETTSPTVETITGEVRNRSMALLRACTGSSASVFYRVNPELQCFEYDLFNISSEENRAYMDMFYRYDPLLPHRHNDSDRSFVVMSRIGPVQGARQYWSFMKQFGISDMAEIFFRTDGRIRAGGTLVRYSGIYGPAEAAELERTLPYVEFVINQFYLPQKDAEKTGMQGQFGFTSRESEILYLLRSGASNVDIAQNLNISLATVKTHMHHILRKTETSNRTEAIATVFLGLGRRLN